MKELMQRSATPVRTLTCYECHISCVLISAITRWFLVSQAEVRQQSLPGNNFVPINNRDDWAGPGCGPGQDAPTIAPLRPRNTTAPGLPPGSKAHHTTAQSISGASLRLYCLCCSITLPSWKGIQTEMQIKFSLPSYPATQSTKMTYN